MGHKALHQSLRLKPHCVPSGGKAALPSPSYCSGHCVEWRRRAQALLASAFPEISAGFAWCCFLHRWADPACIPKGLGINNKRLCRLSWEKWGGVKMFPPKHREDITCKLYFHFLQGRPRSVPGKRDAFISVQDFNWGKETRKPKGIPRIIIRNLKCCPEEERGKMQREKWYLSLN